MQDRLSPREAKSSYGLHAKPVVMSQPEETKVKQRQRLLSNDQNTQEGRHPTPPGKLQMSKISSMLQSSVTEGTAGPLTPAERQSTALQNGHAKDASDASQRHQALRVVQDKISQPSDSNRNTLAVAEAIAQFEKRIGQRKEEASVAKQSSMASPAEEGDRPLSHRSSQRAEALRQLQELWFSDEAEQPGLPGVFRGTEPPSLLPAAATAGNGHADVSSAPQQLTSNGCSSPTYAAAPSASACNGHGDVSLHQEPGQVSTGKLEKQAAALEEHKSASSVLSRVQKGGDEGTDLSDVLATSNGQLQQASIAHEPQSNGDSQGSEQPDHERHSSPSLPPAALSGHQGDLPRDGSGQLEQDNDVPATQRTQRELHDKAAEPLPVSVGAARVSSHTAALANASGLPASANRRGQLQEHEAGSADSNLRDPAEPLHWADDPAWVTGFRDDIGRAMETPLSSPGEHPSLSAERSTPALSSAAGAVHTRKLPLQSGFAESGEEELSRMSTPGSTPTTAAGRAQRGAVPVPLRSSHSRNGLMQGWRSIMHGSPQQSAGKGLSAVAAQKSGLDLAWRLNEVVHELSSCLARTAEQQQLLNDAGRLLTHGEEEDTDYAAEKLQAADELRQWSEAAQCSSIACLVGILKELQHSRQTRMEEVHLDTSAWLAVLGSKGLHAGN